MILIIKDSMNYQIIIKHLLNLQNIMELIVL